MDAGIDVAASIAASRNVNGNVAIQNINGLDARLQGVIFLRDALLDSVTELKMEVLRFSWRRNSKKEPTTNSKGKPVKAFIVKEWNIDVSLIKQRP